MDLDTNWKISILEISAVRGFDCRGGALPDQSKSFVLLKLTIIGDDCDILSKRGGNQDSVKRITMMIGKSKEPQRMLCGKRQYCEVQIEDELVDVLSG